MDKQRCRAATMYLIKTGKLIPQPCEICGETDVEAHHETYDDPSKVSWLCKGCHADIHTVDLKYEFNPNAPEYCCIACGYSWKGRKHTLPVLCPSCKSGTWNKPKVKITVKECSCSKCGHLWVPKIENPKCCPSCKSRGWKRVVDRMTHRNPKIVPEVEMVYDE